MNGRSVLLCRVALLGASLWLTAGARAADNPDQAVIDQAVAAKAVSEAQTAAANAQKAQYEAQAGALKAKFGDIPDSGYGGTATAGTNAGGAEANLLGAKALQAISRVMAADVCGAMSAQKLPCSMLRDDRAQVFAPVAPAASAPKLLVFSASTVPDFQALTAFKAQYTFLDRVYASAVAAANPGAVSAPGIRFLAPVAAIGLGLDAINKLLAFAKTDYSFAALDVTSTDAMLLSSFAHEFPSSVAVVQFPAVYAADIDDSVNLVFDQVTRVYEFGVKARQNQRSFEGAQTEAGKELARHPSDPTKKAALDTYKEGAAIWKNVADTFEAWSKQATTADDKGNVPLSNVIRQGSVKQKLDAGALMLVLQVHKAAGTSYTKKNLWSSLGANPFFVMGGIVAGFTLFSGVDGRVIASGLIPWHGGYHSVDSVESVVNTHR